MEPRSHDAGQASSPIQLILEDEDTEDIEVIGGWQLDDDTRSLTEYELDNDLPLPDDPVPDRDTVDHPDSATQSFECKQEEISETESPFRTPEPQPITRWNEHDTRTLGEFLQNAYGPLPVATIADHVDRSITDTTAMVVCLWLSAIRVSEHRGACIPWWAGRPVFNSTGFGRVSVFTRNGAQILLQLYNPLGELDAEAPIEDPSQIYDQGLF